MPTSHRGDDAAASAARSFCSDIERRLARPGACEISPIYLRPRPTSATRPEPVQLDLTCEVRHGYIGRTAAVRQRHDALATTG